MKLVASVIARNELRRYLRPAVESLLAFCDEIAVVNDGSDDGTSDWLYARELVHSSSTPARFYDNEGAARQWLLDWTLACKPTHILAIDADEFVSDGQALRAVCERDEGNGAWTLPMQEVWAADERFLYTRQDGGWRTHPVPILYRVPERRDARWRIQDRALACGREPLAVRQLAARALPSGMDVLHFGWANRAERRARYERYAQADGGRFHASSHLQSILAPDRRVRLARYGWPAALEPFRSALVERANREAVAA